MLEYRYFTRQPDGSVGESRIFNHPDDISALEHARTLLHGRVIEAWQDARIVFRLMPDGSGGL